MKRLILSLLALMPFVSMGQALTQADFTGVIVPQYLSNGNNSGTASFPGPRLAVAFRATLTNLTASTLYRYYVQAATQSEFAGTASGAGIVLSATPGTTPATTTYATSSTGGLATVGSYATFTTDATGNYTGWFFFVNSNNASRFQVPGTVVFPTITLATDATPGTVVARRALNQSLTLLGFLSGAGATNGTLLTGSSSATPNNVVFTYDNVAGTGRPLSSAVVESIGVATGTTQTGANAYTYSTTAGSYTTVVPNTLPNGVRRVEQRSIVDNSVVGCASSATGIWASGANTVNPVGGITTPLVLTATDTPLNTSACGSATTATVTATPAGPLTFATTTNTPSATQTVTVSGSVLTAGLVVTASTGYEVATTATGPFSASVTLTPATGTVAATPVYVRLASTATASTVTGSLTIASTGATSQTIVLNGTVTVAVAAPTITSFTPITGTTGATVTITGTNLTGATAVTLNGVAITGFTVVNATTITFTVPATATTGTIAVTTPGGTVTSTGTFTFVPAATAPTITSFTPTTGASGVTVTITGTNLTGATTLTVGGVAVTGFTVVNATTITFVLPATAVTGAIVVTTAAGTATSTGTFTVTAPAVVPTITAISPNAQVVGGPALTLTVTGTDFTPTTTVSFNGVVYTPTSTTATTLVVTIPATALATVGSFPVLVTNAAGSSTAFTFVVSSPSTAGAYENFETGTKTGYAAATVTLNSGIWNFSNALLGTSFADKFNGLQSARIRGAGFIAMNFDKTNGAGTVIINAALYGSDAVASFILEKSTDGGANYTTVAGAPAALTATLTPYTFAVNQSGNVRFRITSTNTSTTTAAPRIIIDDISISNVTATLASQALPGLSVFPNPATDRITVALPSAGAATVALRDLTGRVVLAPAALAADQQLRLPAGLASGVYMLEVKQGGVTAVRRIEKN